MISPEDREAMRLADAEIEADFTDLTDEERRDADRRDEAALSDPARSRKERDWARYQRHRETILANAARWRAENREKFLATQASYRERHREELREKELAYYHAHRDEINARRRAKRKEAKT